jgi:alpha-galactosidase
MPKICFCGAGSTVFAKTLLIDILSKKELAHSSIALYDIDSERLQTTQKVAHKIIKQLGSNNTVQATLNRKEALQNADYVITMMQVGGYRPCTVTDFEIPKKYGLQQTIADTLGIGGIMRALRTIPVVLDICKDMSELCPDAYLLNYVNPMAMICWAVQKKYPQIKLIGLCHSVWMTAEELSEDLKVPYSELEYTCAGINHLAFYLTLHRKNHKDESLYPKLLEIAKNKQFPQTNQVRYKLLEHFGYFVTESSEHFSEYVPWFIKSHKPQLIEDFKIPLDEYLRRCEEQLQDWKKMKADLENPALKFDLKESKEYGSFIIRALDGGEEALVYGNFQNENFIENLPDDCCVEVPCKVSHKKLTPVKVGKIPPQLTSLMQTNINVQRLAVEAALTGKKEHIYHAAMLDPHCAAELGLEEICAMVDELLQAHSNWIPKFR